MIAAVAPVLHAPAARHLLSPAVSVSVAGAGLLARTLTLTLALVPALTLALTLVLHGEVALARTLAVERWPEQQQGR